MKFNSIEYKTICQKLGFRAEAQYVKVTNAGTIEPTAGTRSEAFNLWKAVRVNGLKPTAKFKALAKREGFF